MTDAVVITGIGMVSALGHGVAATRAALFEGRGGIGPLTRFDVPWAARAAWAALVPDAPPRERWIAWAIEAAREAVAHVDLGRFDPARIAVVMGTSLGREDDLGAASRAVAAALGARGPCLTVSTACTSSANALGFARDLLVRGDVDLCLAGGADELTDGLFAGFHALGVLAEGPCTPFGPRVGTTLGEGAGFVVLERDATRRTPAVAWIAGWGLSSDAFHETSPDPRGAGVSRAICAALRDARWTPDDVDYVNAHGTGTAANDEAEWLGTLDALGPRATGIPISASKGILGHAQGAAGILELLVTLVCVNDGCVPPSRGAVTRRKRSPADVVAGDFPRRHEVARLLATSSAFGGANAVLAVALRAEMHATPRREVYLAGAGASSPEPRDDAALRAIVPAADPRAHDPLARFMVCAVKRCLDDAALRIAGPLRERAGLFAAAPSVSPTSARAWQDAIDTRGLARPNVAAFARMVLHAAAGSTTKTLSLRGPGSTLAGGAGVGLAAVALAVEHLATRDDVDVVVAAAAREDKDARPELEGAAAVALCVTSGAARVVASVIAGGDALASAKARAASGDGVVTWMEADGDDALTTDAIALLGRALVALRAGTSTRVGVAARDASVSCALVLERNDHGC